MHKVVISSLLLSVSTACCTGKIKEDASKPAIESNYHTAEMRACGDTFLGVGVCYVPVGGLAEFEVQGIYKGQMRVVSTGCGVDETFTYRENELVRLRYPMQDKRCLFGVSITPDFPKSWRGDVVIYGVRGLIAFRQEEGNVYIADALQTGVARPNEFLEVPVEASSKVYVTLGGCGHPIIQKEMVPQNGSVLIPLQEFVDLTSSKGCVLDGYVISEYDDITVTGLYTRFSQDFSPLAIPDAVVDPKSKRLTVTGAPATAVIALDNQFDLSSTACFKNFDQSLPHVLRLYTSKGRSVIGEWNPQEGEWTWMN